MNAFRLSLLVFVLLANAGSLSAQSSAPADNAEGERFHRNTLAGFIGVTDEERRESALTLGLDYNRWFTRSFGIGFGIERAFGDLDFTVYTVPFSYRIGAWKLFAAPGWENADHEEHSEHGGKEFLMRAGMEYAFEIGRCEISPKFMIDYVNEDVVLIAGVSVGYGF